MYYVLALVAAAAEMIPYQEPVAAVAEQFKEHWQ
jgi:hypothetical protein